MFRFKILCAASVLIASPLTASCALAQAPTAPVPGAIVDQIEMIPSRTVRFAPTGDGRFRIISVVDNERFEPVTRTPGEVGMALTYAREIGTVLEFNNGLDWSFDYDLHFVTPTGETLAPDHPVCTVGSERVGAEQWPQPWRIVVISKLRRAEKANC